MVSLMGKQFSIPYEQQVGLGDGQDCIDVLPPLSLPNSSLLLSSGPELEAKRNRSATVIQMFWRRHAAQVLVKNMRLQLKKRKEAELQERRTLAAVEIQVG